MFIAHASKDGRIQPLPEHLENTARLAERFAAVFGAGPWGRLVGELHDIGKLSAQYQAAVSGGNTSPPSHCAAGAQEADQLCGPVGAYCIAGHHTGLPNRGSPEVKETPPSLWQQLHETLSGMPAYRGWACPRFPGPPRLRPLGRAGFSVSFFIRMLYSCLIDADLLDTECFLLDQYAPDSSYEEMLILYSKLSLYLEPFLSPGNPVDKMRARILRACLDQAELPSGLYSLAVPSGGGTLLSSLAFAVRHAVKHDKRRILCVHPAASSMEQTVREYRKILGDRNVVLHQGEWDGGGNPEDDRRFAAENWDAPVVVTSNLLFFESFYSNQARCCRKLHNVAGSVILLQEAQMLPLSRIASCMRVLSELVVNYGCTVVLCGPMPSMLQSYFPQELPIREIYENPRELISFFRPRRLLFAGELPDELLVERLMGHMQVLCAVNSWEHASNLYKRLRGDGCFLLTQLLCPEHRIRMAEELKRRLKSREPCRVIATHAVLVGMDLDFPAVFCALAGLDSILQTAGRCNREQLRPAEDCAVALFQPGEPYRKTQTLTLTLGVECLDLVVREYETPDSPEAILAYFRELYRQSARKVEDTLVKQLDEGVRECRFAFADVARAFCLPEGRVRALMIPAGEDGRRLADRLRRGERGHALLRIAQRYLLLIPEKQWNLLCQEGAAERLDPGLSLLVRPSCYQENAGLAMVLYTGDK